MVTLTYLMRRATVVSVKQERQWTCDVALRRVRVNIVVVEKAILITYYVCVYAFVCIVVI